jgi:dephospho-CoA kinase
MTTTGITGGIGSGKSVVAALLATYGFPVYIADEESKRLVAHSPFIRERLTALLGEDIYLPDGLNRRRMAALIFTDSQLLAKVNAVIHPEVIRHFEAWKQQQSARTVILESAVLFESGLDRKVDRRVTVYAPEALRLQRAMKRDGLQEAEIRQRMASQLPDDAKIRRSDFVVYNDGRQALIPQIEKLVTLLSE